MKVYIEKQASTIQSIQFMHIAGCYRAHPQLQCLMECEREIGSGGHSGLIFSEWIQFIPWKHCQ